jgi:hypothetical protein
MVPHTYKSRHEKAQALFREPEFLDHVCEEIAEGRTLAEICKEHDIPYGLVFRWIKSDEAREDHYNVAVEARKANLEDRVLSGIVGVSEASVADLVDEDGNLQSVKSLPARVAQSVSAFDVTIDETGRVTKKVRMHDKLRALDMIGRSQRMFTERLEVNGSVQLADLVAASMKPKADV